jgi:peptidoglycan/LPS O-acetylase OafA/YrhL
MNLYSWVPIKTLIDQLVNGNNQLELIKVAWSLRVEFLFYLFCFFLIFINSSQFLLKNFKYLSRKKILYVIYIVLLFFFNLFFLFIKNFYISTYFGYLVYFFAGYLFYLLDCKAFNIFSIKYKNFYKNIIFLIVILNVAYQCPLSLRPLAGYFYQDLYSIILFKVIFVGFFLYYFKTPKFIDYGLSIYLGRLSYFIFISHYSIFLIFRKYYDKNTVLILTSIITLLFSMLLFYFCNSLTKNIKN